MTSQNQDQGITFQQLDKREQIPYELLLLADPSKKLIDEYLESSSVFIAKKNAEIVGIMVMFPLTADSVEIKNIAVRPENQGQGVGKYLIENALQFALANKQKTICIGTANSSIGQLYLYQKLGFELTEIRRNFFTDNYSDPIYENGIQAKHMVVLTRQLSDES